MAIGPEVGIVAGAAGARRDGRRIGVERAAFLRGPARFPGEVVERVDEVVHLPEKFRPQRLVVGRAGIGLGDGREIVAGRVAAQAGRLVVPSAERLDALGLLLAEGVPEIVEEAVGIGRRQAAEELVAVLDERRVPLPGCPGPERLGRAERARPGGWDRAGSFAAAFTVTAALGWNEVPGTLPVTV